MTEQMVFTIGEVAAMVGVSPHTIRAWERRHQLLSPRRTPTRQRRYSTDDVDLLLQVKHAITTHGLSLKVAVQAAQGKLTVAAMENVSGETVTPFHPEATPEIAPDEPPWRAVVDLMPQLILIVDRRGCIVDVNHAAHEVLGRAPGALVGRRLLDFVDVADQPQARAALRPPFVRRLDWALRLRTPAQRGTFVFDCLPFLHLGQPRLVLVGRSRLGADHARAGASRARPRAPAAG